jgi:PST family polysaccharide transporter
MLTKNALPFFGTYIFGLLKTSTLTVLIGIFLGMTDVAVYDLGNKIVNIFRNFTQNINTVLFPEVVSKASRNNINRVFRYETIISLTVIILIAIIGYPLILILGGHNMTMAYPVAVILSFTIYSYLIVGAYLNFIFVPNEKYTFITIDQMIAMLTSIGSLPLLAWFFGTMFPDFIVLSVPIAMTISSVIELLFCRYIDKKTILKQL